VHGFRREALNFRAQFYQKCGFFYIIFNKLEFLSRLYLRHVLTHIAAAETVEQIEALLPWHVRLIQPLDDPQKDKSGTA
jgi:hypothetical protein